MRESWKAFVRDKKPCWSGAPGLAEKILDVRWWPAECRVTHSRAWLLVAPGKQGAAPNTAWLCCLAAGGSGVTRPISNIIGELGNRTAEKQGPQGAVSRASEVRGCLPSAKPGKVSCRCGARSAPKASLEQVLKGGGSDRGAPLCAPGLQCPEGLQQLHPKPSSWMGLPQQLI